MPGKDQELQALVAAELAEPVAEGAVLMARAIAERHGKAARAVLFYGSCLRDQQFDGLMLDFYLIVSDYRAAYEQRWLGAANALIPPNVFPFAFDGLVAKYAVLSEADFARGCSLAARTVSVWARFAQPSRLLWAADHEAREQAIATVATAAPTFLSLANPLTPDVPDAAEPHRLALWRTGFALTYGAELRAERGGRPDQVVDAHPERYARFTQAAAPLLTPISRSVATRAWRALRWRGKVATIARLLKASLTFANGIDYLAWKVNRHAGTTIALKPWQRRWPILGAFSLLPRLMKNGAVR